MNWKAATFATVVVSAALSFVAVLITWPEAAETVGKIFLALFALLLVGFIWVGIYTEFENHERRKQRHTTGGLP